MENNYDYKINEFTVDLNDIQYSDHYPIKINKKYMIVLIKNTILVYDLKNSLLFDDMVRIESNMTFNNFDFHTNNDNIFFYLLR